MPQPELNIPLHRLRSSGFLSGNSNHRSPSLEDADEVIHLPSSGDDTPDIHPTWKRELHALMEHPASGPLAFLLHIILTSLILFSAMVTILETVPAFHFISPRLWLGIETTIVALFTVEYIARAVAWSGAGWLGLAKWFFSFFGIVDFLAIIPYYIEILLHRDTSVLFRFSILRMFRLLRVFRPFRHNHTILLTIEVMFLSVRRSQHALFAIGFFVIMILTVFSTLLYFAERGTWDETLETFINSDGDPTQFTSIPAAAWFVLVTITTVGYGEITPRSFLGRLITLPLLVFGILLVALPSFVLGREFSSVWSKMSFKKSTGNDMPLAEGGAQSPTGEISGENALNRIRLNSRTELSRQISELRGVIEVQGELIRRLANVMQERGDMLRTSVQ